MTRRPILRGIRSRLLVAFSALVAAIAIFTFMFFPARLERQAMRAIVAKATAIREMTAYSISAGLFFNDSLAVAEVLRGASQVNDVTYLVVWDAERRMVATRGIEPAAVRQRFPVTAQGASSPDERTFVSAAPVMHGNTIVGAIAVGISLEPLRTELAAAEHVGALVGVLILGLGILGIFAISTLITRPLTDVSHTVDRIAAGDLSLRAAETGGVEIDRLVRAFNGMVDTLVGTQGELARMNEELEVRVAVRTSELTKAVDEQRRSQSALMISELQARRTSETLQSLIDVAPQAIVAVDLDWRVKRWNRAAERLFGWTADEVLGKPLPYIPEDQMADFDERRKAILAGTGFEAVEVRRVRKDGTPITVLLAAGILRDRDQQVVGFISFAVDLTERKRLEEQLRQSQKMEALGRLAGGVAHDFNNILTVITAYTDLLLAEETVPARRDNLEQVSGAAARAAALTKQLLTFTRQQVVRVREVELATVVRELEPMLRRVLRANIRFTVLCEDSAGMVSADPTQLEQVLMNLVVNAADAMPDGGSLVVETRAIELRDSRSGTNTKVPPGEYTLLSVRDTGVGMAEATMRRIFEPFFTTKEVGKGTGLGLATTYAIITDLGGTIDVASKLGHGTTFDIYIPRTDVSDILPASTPPMSHMAVPDKVTGTVLLVEDEEAVRRVVRRTLERAGYRVLEASDGESGLAVAAERHDEIDAVVTDMMMPGMNGAGFAAELSRRFPALGVVFISGYTAGSLGNESLVDDRHMFVQKPFSPGQLVVAIERVGRGEPVGASSTTGPTPEP